MKNKYKNSLDPPLKRAGLRIATFNNKKYNLDICHKELDATYSILYIIYPQHIGALDVKSAYIKYPEYNYD
jgi:hypothetical protein